MPGHQYSFQEPTDMTITFEMAGQVAGTNSTYTSFHFQEQA